VAKYLNWPKTRIGHFPGTGYILRFTKYLEWQSSCVASVFETLKKKMYFSPIIV
jgi:hypothetical protein